MQCQLCHGLYSLELLRPRNLDCGHVFCEKCIQGICLSQGAFKCLDCQVTYSPAQLQSVSISFGTLDAIQHAHRYVQQLSLLLNHKLPDIQGYQCTIPFILSHSGQTVRTLPLQVSQCGVSQPPFHQSI